MLQRYSVRLRIHSWFMKYCHPKLASAGVIVGDVARRQHLPAEGWPRARRSRSAFSRVGSLPSSEVEARGAVEGLGGEPSREAEIALRVRGGLDGPHRV